MTENPNKRFHGVLETIKNTRARGLREFSITRPSKTVTDRIKAEGHTIRESPQPGKIIVEIMQVPVSEMVEEEEDTP